MTPERRKCAVRSTAETSIARQWLAIHVSAATSRPVETRAFHEINTRSMEMLIPGDRLGTQRVPLSADKQQMFSMVTVGGFILHSSFILSDS
jgi:hypothetical protein